MPQLQLDDLRPLLGHPTLRGVSASLGGVKKNARAEALLGLPEVKFDWSCHDEQLKSPASGAFR